MDTGKIQSASPGPRRAREDGTNETRLLAREGAQEVEEAARDGARERYCSGGPEFDTMYAWNAAGAIQASALSMLKNGCSTYFLVTILTEV